LWDVIVKTERHRSRGVGDNRTSVLNKWNRSHDIKNPLVVDGSALFTCGWQNPTMTIGARRRTPGGINEAGRRLTDKTAISFP